MSNIQLLTINDYNLPNPLKGNLTITNKPIFNKYECEDGSIKIEVIKSNVINGSVTYKGLFESEVKAITNKLSLISKLTLYNPIEQGTTEISALITDISVKNIVTKDDVKAWSLSFKIEEINR